MSTNYRRYLQPLTQPPVRDFETLTHSLWKHPWNIRDHLTRFKRCVQFSVEWMMPVNLSATTMDLVDQYWIPNELVPFIDDGFLVVLTDDWDEKSVEFHLPSKAAIDTEGRVTSYSVYWIHPDFNRECCHSFEREPGDLPHFHATKVTTDLGSDLIDGIETAEYLAAWLQAMRCAGA